MFHLQQAWIQIKSLFQAKMVTIKSKFLHGIIQINQKKVLFISQVGIQQVTMVNQPICSWSIQKELKTQHQVEIKKTSLVDRTQETLVTNSQFHQQMKNHLVIQYTTTVRLMKKGMFTFTIKILKVRQSRLQLLMKKINQSIKTTIQ